MRVPEPLPHGRRSTDGPRGVWRVFSDWYFSRQGQAAVGVLLIFLAAVVTAAIIIYTVNQSQAAALARAACERTRTFAPALARAYDRYGILTDAQLEKYRESIPDHCD